MSFLLRHFAGLCVRHGTLLVETANGRRFTVGDGTGLPVGLRFMDRRAEREILFDPAMALGNLFTEGRLRIFNGSVIDLIDRLGRNLKAMTPPALGIARQSMRTRLDAIRVRNTERRCRSQIAHHYNQDRRLYDLFLDPDMQYSCAYFEYSG